MEKIFSVLLSLTDAADASTDTGVPACKRARFDGPHPVSSIRYYFETDVVKRSCRKTSDVQLSNTEEITARLEAQRSRLACAVLLSEHELAPRPSKKLIMASLHQPADGCQGINISQSDFLTLLPGQWLSDNVSFFTVQLNCSCVSVLFVTKTYLNIVSFSVILGLIAVCFCINSI